MILFSCLLPCKMIAVENIIRCTPDDDLNNLLKPGVTLELLPGKYRKNLVIDQDNITIRAVNPKDDSTEVCFWRSTIAINNAKNVSIEGLVLRQSPATSIQINNGSSFISIKKCKFFACNTYGIQLGTSGVCKEEGRHMSIVPVMWINRDKL